MLASVVNRQGGRVLDVGVDDFVVEENGRPRDVLDVHVADYPVVVVIDDESDPLAFAAIKSAVVRFVGRIGERPVAIGTFAHPGDVIGAFDTDRAALLKQLDALAPAAAAPVAADSPTTPPPSPGSAPAADGGDASRRTTALVEAARLLREADVPFSAIVVLTTHIIDATAHVSPETVAAILDVGANVNVIAGGANQDAGGAGGSDLFRVLATQTRGQYTPIFATASYGIALERIADRMATELMIEYVAPAGTPSADVKVGVKIPGVRVIGLGVR